MQSQYPPLNLQLSTCNKLVIASSHVVFWARAAHMLSRLFEDSYFSLATLRSFSLTNFIEDNGEAATELALGRADQL